jgi:quinoprotein glucose dehydrogenase
LGRATINKKANSMATKLEMKGARWPALVSSALLLVTALGLGVPGAYLASLGGSNYYIIAGIVLLVAAVLVFGQRRSGLWLYAAFFVATFLWSLWEVGFDGWALMPRLVYFAVGGLWLCTPWVRNSASL